MVCNASQCCLVLIIILLSYTRGFLSHHYRRFAESLIKLSKALTQIGIDISCQKLVLRVYNNELLRLRIILELHHLVKSACSSIIALYLKLVVVFVVLVLRNTLNLLLFIITTKTLLASTQTYYIVKE